MCHSRISDYLPLLCFLVVVQGLLSITKIHYYSADDLDVQDND